MCTGLAWACLTSCLGPTPSLEVHDSDGDGYAGTSDCDDSDAGVNPGATERCGDGLDNDCDGEPGQCMLRGDVTPTEAPALLLGAADDAMGYHLAVIADAGRTLLVATAPFRDSRTGAAFAFDALPPPQGAMSQPAMLIEGEPEAELGLDVAVGDVNQDGALDLVLTAREGTTGTAGAGMAWVHVGPVLSPTQLPFVITGPEEGGNMVHACAPAHDAPFGLVLGASWAGSDDAGAVYVLPPGLQTDASVSAATTTIRWDDADMRWFGSAAACSDDLDGDGLVDLALGANRDSRGGTGAGAVAIFDDPAAATGPADAAALFIGDQTAGGAGEEILAKDLDQDGYGDLIVTAPAAREVYILPGPFAGTIGPPSAATTLLGTAGAVDAEWDGERTLVAVVHGDRVVIVDLIGTGTIDLDRPNEMVVSPEGDLDRRADSLALDDLNSDGSVDLAVGFARSDRGGEDSGVVALYFGPGW
jgi:hypothetical protein